MQLTVRDVAQLLNVSDKTVYRWINQGEIPAYRFQDQYRFNEAEMLEWAAARKINASPFLYEIPQPENFVLPEISELLLNGGIFYRLEGNDPESAIRSLISVMPIPDETIREFLIKSYLAREALGSTAVGDGIAIPHARVRVVPYVVRPLVAIGFLEKPVDFQSLDGLLVKTLFTTLSPNLQTHLHTLSRFSFALRDSQLREALAGEELRETILNHFRRIEANWLTTGKPQPRLSQKT